MGVGSSLDSDSSLFIEKEMTRRTANYKEIGELEEKLNRLVTLYKNTSAETKHVYERVINKHSKTYFILTGKYYNWQRSQEYRDAEELREATNNFCI